MERQRYIEAMSRAATGVCIVTTNGDAGQFGLTVSAMASVSADPPTLLICINRKNPIRDAIVANDVFAVSILRADQRWVAETFSGRPRHGDPYDFQTTAWDAGITTSPMLAGAVCRFDCVVSDLFEHGSHTIFVGNVVAADDHPGSPLAYYHRHFAEMRPMPLPRGQEESDALPVWDEMAGEEQQE